MTQDTQNPFLATLSAYEAKAQELTQFKTARRVDPGIIGTAMPESDGYPGVFVALMGARKLEWNSIGGPGHISIKYELEIGTMIHVNSDGAELGDANPEAWSLAYDLIMKFVPTAVVIPSFPTYTAWPAIPGDMGTVMVSQGHGGIWLPFNVQIQWTT